MNGSLASTPIAISGTGLVCALGLNKQQTWNAIVRGECGIGPLTSIEQSLPIGHEGGEVRDVAGIDLAGEPREVVLLRLALREALDDAGISGEWPCSSERVTVILGTTLAGMRAAGRFLRSSDHADLHDFTAAAVLQRALAGLPVTGLTSTTCAACASGLSSIALGVTLLRDATCDLVIAGGYDPISEYACAGFHSLRLVSAGPPRPFSRDRQGLKLAEGYAVVVLERESDVAQRGARSLAIVAGFGESSDAHHLTQPEPTGDGAARAMDAALRDARIDASKIDFISAHATATPNNDAAEFAAYQRTFNDRLPQTPVVAFKSHLGHTLGGAGAVELILSTLVLCEQTIPAVATVSADEIEFPGLNLIVTQPRRPAHAIEYALNLSMGFGGANACVILQRASGRDKASTHHATRTSGARSSLAPLMPHQVDASSCEVLITGVGVLLPGSIGNDAFVRMLRDPLGASHPSLLHDTDYDHLFNARRARRMSEYVKLILAATSLAMEDAGIDDVPDFARGCGAILGTTHGATGYSETYYRQVVVDGIMAANPMLFAEGVPNVASAQLSLMLGLKGGAQTIVGSRTAGLEALHLAARRIASSTGGCDRLIVGAAEERSDLIEAAYRHCESPDLITSAGAVALVLESANSVAERSARPRGRMLASAGRRVPRLDRCALSSAAATLLRDTSGAGDTTSAPISLVGPLSQMFSVNALAELAAALLGGLDGANARDRRDANQCSILATDPLGLAVAARVQILPRRAG